MKADLFNHKMARFIPSSELRSGQSDTLMNKIEAKEDRQALREAERAKRKLDSRVDDITRQLRIYYDKPSMCVYNFYTNNNFPHDERGQRMSVTKYYPTENLVVDSIPAKWSMERIIAKKWAIEQLGFSYVWMKQDEAIKSWEDFFERAKKLATKPAFEIRTLVRLG